MSSEPIPINTPVRLKAGYFTGRQGSVVGYEGDQVQVCFRSGRKIWCHPGSVEVIVPPRPIAPTIAETVGGILAWQQEDPQLRRATIQLTGHIVDAWVTILPDLSAKHAKFRMPFSVDETRIILEALADGPAGRTAVVDGRETSDGPVETSILDGGD